MATPQNYRSIFRLDYPAQFRLLDSIGELADHVEKISVGRGAGRVSTTYDVSQHKVTASGELEGYRFVLNLTIKTLDGVVECPNGGAPLGAGNPILDHVDELLAKMKVQHFDRIGYRIWAIAQSPDLTFEAVKARFLNQLIFVKEAVDIFGNTDDVAVVFEASAGSERLRVATGPYRRGEFKKYFSEDPGVECGQIADVDVSQSGVAFPGLSMRKFAIRAEKKSRAIVLHLVQRQDTQG